VPTYSPSRLSTYEQCPRQYRYKYVDRIPREDETIESFMGHCVHAALERLYADLQMAKEVTLPEILEHYRQAWGAGWHEGIRIVRQEYTAEQYRRLGERCLTAYYHRHTPFDEGTTLGLEAKMAVALDEAGAYTIQGIIDRLVGVGEGRYEIHDYKTGGGSPPRTGWTGTGNWRSISLRWRRPGPTLKRWSWSGITWCSTGSCARGGIGRSWRG